MQDLLKIIKWKDELIEIEYMLLKLDVAETNFVKEEQYEKAQLMLLEQKRLQRKRSFNGSLIKFLSFCFITLGKRQTLKA